jgi:hypothetical protein
VLCLKRFKSILVGILNYNIPDSFSQNIPMPPHFSRTEIADLQEQFGIDHNMKEHLLNGGCAQSRARYRSLDENSLGG